MSTFNVILFPEGSEDQFHVYMLFPSNNPIILSGNGGNMGLSGRSNAGKVVIAALKQVMEELSTYFLFL